MYEDRAYSRLFYVIYITQCEAEHFIYEEVQATNLPRKCTGPFIYVRIIGKKNLLHASMGSQSNLPQTLTHWCRLVRSIPKSIFCNVKNCINYSMSSLTKTKLMNRSKIFYFNRC